MELLLPPWLISGISKRQSRRELARGVDPVGLVGWPPADRHDSPQIRRPGAEFAPP